MRYVVKTDVGVVRQENQDRAAIIKNDQAVLAILCDGMGGHTGGSIAASIAVDVFEKEFQKGFREKNINRWFKETISKIRKAMSDYAQGDTNLLDMGTTLTCAIIFPQTIYIFNIGDSRTYIFNGLLHQITRDHNLRNHYIDKNNYSLEEAAKLVGAMALTSALGPTKKTTIDPFVIARSSDMQYIILTCDGIHDYISKPGFAAILESKSMTLTEKASKLIVESIKSKSSDNLTVALLELEGGA